MEQTSRRFVSVYIFSPFVDNALIIFSPVIFLGVGAFIGLRGFGELRTTLGGHEQPAFYALATAFTLSHIFAVFFRTHLNREVHQTFPVRFIVVPLIVFLAMQTSRAAWIAVGVIIIYMDLWHSSMQTFGFGRIYDKRAGNDVEVGRRLDMGMALLTYSGPALAGVALLDHLERLPWFEEIGMTAPSEFRIWAIRHQPELARVMLVAGVLYSIFYVLSYVRYVRRGYKIPIQKVLLYVSLTLTSVWTWGFDTFGQAYLIMESFHALQYFPIVWKSEKSNIQRRLGFEKRRGAEFLSFCAFLVPCAVFGVWAAYFATTEFAISVCFLAEGMHYWYDGFIWSVRKNQVS